MNIRRGNILPLALIMTLTILLTGIGIAAVVLEGSQRAVATDQSVAAYYMADAGIERQLFEVRKNNQTVSYLATLSGTYNNNGTWVSTGAFEPTTNKKISFVSTSSFAVLDLFDPDNLTTKPGITTMAINWTKDPSCSGPQSNLEVSYAYWTIVAGVPQLSNDYVVLPKNGTGTFTVNSLDPNSAYRVRLRAFGCGATNVTVALSDGGGPKVFPGDITLGAEGTYGKATQKIAVTMPKLDVLSGLFGFVIFSECQLVKGTGGVPTCP